MMIRQLLVWLAGIAVTVTTTAAAKANDEGDTVFRLMTFNIRYNNPNDGPDAWPHRKDMVAKIIREHADIAGLQEARVGQIADLEQRLPEFAWYGVGRDDGKQGGEFCPVFYRKDRFQLLDQKTYWLSKTPTVPGSKDWDAAITRIATIVTLRDLGSNEELCVINTHFDHVGSESRAESAKLIKKFAAEMDSALPVLVTGDFNTLPDSEPYNLLIAERGPVELNDSRAVSEHPPEGPNSTWCGFREVAPDRRIDFVFVEEGVNVLRHTTIARQFDGRFPSDHLPVVVDVRR